MKLRNHKSAGNFTNIDKGETKKRFRLNRKNLFLTYSQTDITPEECYQQLAIKLGKWGIDDHVIVQEKHKVEIQTDHEVEEKPGTHLHCYIALTRRCDIKNQDFLHLTNEKGQIAKGNYQGAKDQNAIIQYVLKHIDLQKDNHLVVMSKGIESRISKIKGFEEDVNVSAIRLAREGQIEDAMMLMEKHFPREFLRSHVRLERTFRDLYRKTKQIKPKYKANDFRVPQALEDFLKQQKENQYEKTIVIFGRPNTGKTQFVQTYLDNEDKRYLYARDLNDLAKFENGVHEFIILDDCDRLSNVTREAILSILGAEDQGSIRILYQAVQIPSGTGRIIICNELDYAIPRYFQSLPEVKRRFVAFEIKDSLKAKKQSLLTEADPYDKLVSPTDQESYPTAKG